MQRLRLILPALAFCLVGCPRAVPLSDIELASLTLVADTGTRHCLSRPVALTVYATTTSGERYRTPRIGEGQGNRLKLDDFQFESSHGTITADGRVLITDPIPLLYEELVVRVRPAGATGPGTKTPEWVKDELRLTPRFDCTHRLGFDGADGSPGSSGAWGEHGLDGADGGDEQQCTAAENGRSGQSGGAGANGGDGRDGMDLRIDVAVAHSPWRHRLLVVRATSADLSRPYYAFVDPNLVDSLAISTQGGDGGPGGDGGRGGNGGKGGDSHCNQAAPGNGGDGGDGGNGGHGGQAGHGGRIDLFAPVKHTEVVEWLTLQNRGGIAGVAGRGGSAGNGGREGTSPTSSTGFPGKDGRYGQDGQPGTDGAAGPAVNITFSPASQLFAPEVQQGLQLR